MIEYLLKKSKRKMRFKYTALSGNNQKAEGLLEAASKEAAQQELHRMGLSIIAIESVSDEEYGTLEKTKPVGGLSLRTLFFEAVDPNGKAVNGTIEAEEDYAALKRLVTEYHFKVSALYPQTADEAGKALAANRLRQLLVQLKSDGIDVDTRAVAAGEERESVIDQELVAEIDKIIKTGKTVFEKHGNLFSGERLRQVNEVIGDLERIRTSNNVRHIAEVSNRLFSLIDNPDNRPAGAETPAEYQKTMESVKGSRFLKDETSAYKKAIGLQAIRGVFRDMTKRLKGFGKKTETMEAPEKASPAAEPKPEVPTAEPAMPGFKKVLFRLRRYLEAPNAIAKEVRKHEWIEAWQEWHPWKKQPVAKETPETAASSSATPSITGGASAKTAPNAAPAAEKPAKPKRDFALFFMEADSFISWLLFFYAAYFFLAGAAIEKNKGLPADFVLKTLESPLLFNIAFFLLISHTLLRLKTRRFHQNAPGSAFLFLLGYGLFVFIIFNF